jgi:ribonuclease T1
VSSRRRITVALVGLVLLGVIGWLVKDLTGGSSAHPVTVPGASSGLPVEPISALPAQVGQTYQLIRKGGPFPYPQHDGVVFGNREHRLPSEKSGYYHEYTVPTPGGGDRGTRRLITGSRGELYYTGDHYSSFVVVDPGR